MPVITLNGVRKSKVPPVNWRPSVAKPCTKAPSTMPCEEGREQRAEEEGVVPEEFRALRLEAELEGDAAKDQGDEHEDDRHVERRHEHRIGDVEDREEAAAAEDQPGLVAVPDRRDREHHPVAPVLAAARP